VQSLTPFAPLATCQQTSEKSAAVVRVSRRQLRNHMVVGLW
jgi:hypothetical protein